ncbi:MAG: DUF1580 domain-containing protein [Thermoguttaceae bacterium]|jgi:hypothetical protein
MKVTIKLPQKDRFTMRETATVLDKDVSTIWRFAMKGVRGIRLSTFLIGARRYVLRESILAFLDDINSESHDADQGSRRDQRVRQNRDAEATERALIAEKF